MMAMDSDEVIDLATFGQLLELDDDEDDREFSASLLSNYFGQAHETLGKMRVSLAANDLAALGKQGHFLKAHIAADAYHCGGGLVPPERMQLLGAHRTVDGRCVDEATALQEAARLISQIELECNEGRARMEAFYKTVFA
ncbi:Phosphorelay intermediate protein [Polyrhizophydium stewartii]|uniref:Phosphorelay intermediate protein n=1 Tax=Polyrhizophydium stewartii TaxID=2732419 RepID=A0ABR4N0I0_9FUNG